MNRGHVLSTGCRAATGLLLAFACLRAGAQSDGIYADFTTSMGSFTCRLEYAKAPKAVANFIGLAAGARAWLDLPTGLARTNAFYDGLTFHRVITNFMIQGGSPAGDGSDGPGYAFLDEFDPSLRHDGAGVLSLANSGPNSNGSQFFITVTATPWLDDVHTVFGRVVDGQSVVNAISLTPTDANSRPLTPVIIQHVAIRRVGAAANAFDIGAQQLPEVTHSRSFLTSADALFTLHVPAPPFSDHRVCGSSNLVNWAAVASLGVEGAQANTNSKALVVSDASRYFFSTARIQYAHSTRAPRSLYNRVLQLVLDDGLGTVTITFDAEGGGVYTWSIDPAPGTVTEYTWEQDIYRGYLWPIYFSGIVPMTLTLDFTSDTEGTFEGTAYHSPSFPVSGTFTLSP